MTLWDIGRAIFLVIPTPQGRVTSLNERMKRVPADMDDLRLDLLDAATGGGFQQTDWQPDPQRVVRMARIVTRIVRLLA